MGVNNETGVIQPVADLAAIARAAGALFHTDAAQAVGKTSVDGRVDGARPRLDQQPQDLWPEGLWARCMSAVAPACASPRCFRAAVRSVGCARARSPHHVVVGFGEACRIAAAEMAEDAARIGALRERLLAGLRAAIPGVVVNGSRIARIAGNLNVTLPHASAARMMEAMPDLCVSTGSACSSADIEPSYVLRALGLSDAAASRTLRIGVGRFTSRADIDTAIAALVGAHESLRQNFTAPQPA